MLITTFCHFPGFRGIVDGTESTGKHLHLAIADSLYKGQTLVSMPKWQNFLIRTTPVLTSVLLIQWIHGCCSDTVVFLPKPRCWINRGHRNTDSNYTFHLSINKRNNLTETILPLKQSQSPSHSFHSSRSKRIYTVQTPHILYNTYSISSHSNFQAKNILWLVTSVSEVSTYKC